MCTDIPSHLFIYGIYCKKKVLSKFQLVNSCTYIRTEMFKSTLYNMYRSEEYRTLSVYLDLRVADDPPPEIM